MKKIKDSPVWAGKGMALILVLLLYFPAFGQENLPSIRATSKNVLIKDGYVWRSGIWSLSPETKPDIYHPLQPLVSKTISFYTDIDSITFRAEPGNTYGFNIILNSKDTCITQIVMDNRLVEAGYDKLKMISPELLAMDFLVFRNYMEKEHAGLYRYRSKKEIKKLFDDGLLSIDEQMSQLEFGKKIMYLISKVQDGHTGTNLSSKILKAYGNDTPIFPLSLYFTNENTVVRYSKFSELPIGTEILAINGIPMKEIKKTLFDYLPADGQIQTKKQQILNNGAFAFLYRLVYGNSNSFMVDRKGLKGRVTVKINAVLAKDLDDNISNTKSNAKDLQFSHLPSGIVLLTIKTFDQGRLKQAKLNVEAFLEKSFQQMDKDKTDKLIIDLRGNAGGLDIYGPLLFSYLSHKPFRYFKSIYKANNAEAISDNPLVELQQPQRKSFEGKIMFLIDGLTFSSAADFCAMAKSNGIGSFVGEETGGAYYGNTSGQTIKIELPNSKIQIVIPRFAYFNEVKKVRYKDRGTLPDYPIAQKLEDIIKAIDKPMQKAIELLSN
ncbi:S41 family peptidase [Pedobacter sp. ASV28]|uniref:S41 family peptidase n=1 Tax=Pedobacter sp. ASV28 TaxID=2795123 RepID=UPI0018EC80A9|nr:S41 family peptidase [Pedobacter sp. ASV28]